MKWWSGLAGSYISPPPPRVQSNFERYRSGMISALREMNSVELSLLAQNERNIWKPWGCGKIRVGMMGLPGVYIIGEWLTRPAHRRETQVPYWRMIVRWSGQFRSMQFLFKDSPSNPRWTRFQRFDWKWWVYILTAFATTTCQEWWIWGPIVYFGIYIKTTNVASSLWVT